MANEDAYELIRDCGVTLVTKAPMLLIRARDNEYEICPENGYYLGYRSLPNGVCRCGITIDGSKKGMVTLSHREYPTRVNLYNESELVCCGRGIQIINTDDLSDLIARE
jgi:hypothetical protein